MSDQTHPAPRRRNPLRIPVWGAAAGLLALPAIAMALKVEGVDWSPFDFMLMGVLLFGSALAYEIAAWLSGALAYRLAAGLSILAGLLMTWANLAVGLLGPEGGIANMLLLLVPLTAVIGAAIARFRPGGMVVVMLGLLALQLAIGAVALTEPPTTKGFGWPWHILAVTGFFGAAWTVAAGLFRKAARTAAG